MSDSMQRVASGVTWARAFYSTPRSGGDLSNPKPFKKANRNNDKACHHGVIT